MFAAVWGAIRHLRDLIDERDLRYQQRFDAQNIALSAAAATAKEAVEKAESSVNDRLTLLNELRQGVATTEQLAALEKIVDVIDSRLQTVESERAGAGKLVTKVYAGIGTAVAIIGLIVLFSNGVL
jgi:hypothetical protein